MGGTTEGWLSHASLVHYADVREAHGTSLQGAANHGVPSHAARLAFARLRDRRVLSHDTTKVAALQVLTTLCGFHLLEMLTQPIDLFPTEWEYDPMWREKADYEKDV